jgi:hypothetical protein
MTRKEPGRKEPGRSRHTSRRRGVGVCSTAFSHRVYTHTWEACTGRAGATLSRRFCAARGATGAFCKFVAEHLGRSVTLFALCSHEDVEQMPARFAALCLVSSWLGIAGRDSTCCGIGACNKVTSRQSLAGLTAAVLAQGLVAEAVGIVQRSARFRDALSPLKTLVSQQFARARSRDPFSRQLVRDTSRVS